MRLIRQIAGEAFDDMITQTNLKSTSVDRKFPHLFPYMKAMLTIEKLDDQYHADSAESVVAYFLANASTWRGETARRIKAELNGMLKAHRS